MPERRFGITVAGNVLADIVKTIDCYPEIGMLSNITSVSRAVGGCAPNTAIDLAKIDPALPLSVLGRVGDDEYGRYVVAEMQKYGIDTQGVSISPDAPTSFSDVMSMPSGERTFFHARGANAQFSPKHIDTDALRCRILHIGYILLLDAFDAPDAEYGTVMARFLHDVQARGIKTSIDAVSDSTGKFAEKIKPALRYCDYVIFNEIECCSIWGLAPYGTDGKVDVLTIEKAMRLTLDCGVREKVIVHCKKAGFCLSADSSFTVVPSIGIPRSCIKGSVGAGDAFCAGSLYGIYHGFTDKKILSFAAAAAACNLFSENSVDGMRGKDEIWQMIEKYGYEPML
ncbi:MAG: carbohydrate kinase family protein [Clostridia bacterium]|nr:carbohydrate kinase family protein [Clostridia bacterium]